MVAKKAFLKVDKMAEKMGSNSAGLTAASTAVLKAAYSDVYSARKI